MQNCRSYGFLYIRGLLESRTWVWNLSPILTVSKETKFIYKMKN